MEHQPGQGLARRLLAMRPASGRARHVPAPCRIFFVQVYDRVPSCSMCQCSCKMLDAPTRVPGLIQRHHPQGFIHRHRAGRGPTEPPIVQPRDPLGFIAVLPAAKCPLRDP